MEVYNIQRTFTRENYSCQNPYICSVCVCVWRGNYFVYINYYIKEAYAVVARC